MGFDPLTRDSLVQSLRSALPLSARPRPALLDFLRARGASGRNAPRLVIVDIFNAGAQGLMCRFKIADESDAADFVAPLAQIALDRRYRSAQRLVAHPRHASRRDAA
ncbi:MAG: hypothetical protein AB7F41_13685 [Methylocystis sp.]|uniref:hypothetical protein n=1 Tax=Methylocystis sp. TaxID=1911079 RepID=UPI003D0A3B6B